MNMNTNPRPTPDELREDAAVCDDLARDCATMGRYTQAREWRGEAARARRDAAREERARHLAAARVGQ